MGLCDGDLVGSVNIGSGGGSSDVNIASSDPAIVISESPANTFNIELNEAAAKLPSLVVSYTAGELISALKVVYVKVADGKVYKASSAGTPTECLAVGIATNAAIIGGNVDVIIMGVLADVGWSWSANDLLFLTPGGGITNVAPIYPTDTYLVSIGKALTNNKILVNIESPIKLA